MLQTAAKTKVKKDTKLRSIKRYIPLFIMMIPGLIYLIINNYLPMFGLIIAFKNIDYSKGILGSEWAGLKNFEYLFKSTDAWIITRNTVLYNAAFIIIGTISAIMVAIILNEIKSKFLSRLYQTVILLPFLMSMVIVSYLVYAALSTDTGFINKTILPMLKIEPISWYSEAKYWPVILTVVHLWKNIGFSCIIYLASIVGIDGEYYEAATLDGATKWQQIIHITIPLIKPVIIMTVILAIGRIFNSDFGLFYQVPMDSGAIYETTNTIDTYVYRGLLKMGDVGMSSAANLYQSVVGFILVILSNAVIRKVSREDAMF
ncbi:ABC transporter permease subunit [Clostridium sp. SYSU_GA19001]|uniref:ABC transporter permease n=1 Tax=Clostridium caldaquaticum TaxID=2940653 RepID=UPI0020776E34|nr:ABC transporter permease subunit [Clostridium caldaquaticum]MCM8710043.1 ABC transporter permease subunit [Clostridium caldaquaticum]